MKQTPSITLSNGHKFTWGIASGGLSFDGRGWPWEAPLEALGLIDTSLFTIVAKTVTRLPREGNLKSLLWPWNCIRRISGGWVNKVGLTNPGMDWWFDTIGQFVDSRDIKLACSLFGDRDDLLYGTERANRCDLVAIELNLSCPNAAHKLQSSTFSEKDENAAQMAIALEAVETIEKVCFSSKHPVIVKLSCNQPFLQIARLLSARNIAEAISMNSVPWETVNPGKKSPLHRLEKRIKGGGGGVSGQEAQPYNWSAMSQLANDPGDSTLAGNKIPVIGASIWRYSDIEKVFNLGSKAISFGSISIGRPLAPTRYVRRWTRENQSEVK